MSRMPVMPVATMLAAVSDVNDRATVAACFHRGNLRASKPFRKPVTLGQASANYVWRMLCFSFCDFTPHCCMPVTADFDIMTIIHDSLKVPHFADDSPRAQELRAECRRQTEETKKRLDTLVKLVESVVPIQYHKGTLRWGRALGMI